MSIDTQSVGLGYLLLRRWRSGAVAPITVERSDCLQAVDDYRADPKKPPSAEDIMEDLGLPKRPSHNEAGPPLVPPIPNFSPK
jgi:hypothetical protein